MRMKLLALGAAALMAGACGGGGSSLGPIAGHLAVPQYPSQIKNAANGLLAGQPCLNDDGYDDISSGVGVTVRDASNKIIASSNLGTQRTSDGTCIFPFSIPRFHAATKFISIEVGRRGEVNYEVAKLRADHWAVEMTLGT